MQRTYFAHGAQRRGSMHAVAADAKRRTAQKETRGDTSRYRARLTAHYGQPVQTNLYPPPPSSSLLLLLLLLRCRHRRLLLFVLALLGDVAACARTFVCRLLRSAAADAGRR